MLMLMRFIHCVSAACAATILPAQNVLESNGDPLNDTAAGAEAAVFGAQHYGSHATPTDSDFWAITVTNAPRRLTCWTTTRGVATSQDDTVIELIHSDGTTILVSNDDEFMAPGNMSFLSVTLGVNQTYYVNVRPSTVAGPHTGDYALDIHDGDVNVFGPLCASVTPFPPFIEIEPNDTCASAGFAVGCTSRIENLQSAGDSDFFSLIGDGQTVVFETVLDTALGSARNDTKLWLYDSACVELANDDDSGAGLLSRLQHTLVNGRTYFIEVSDWQRLGAGDYRLDVTEFGFTHPSGPPGSQSLVDLQPGAASCLGSTGSAVLLSTRIGERPQRRTTVSCDLTGAPPGLATPAVMHVGLGGGAVNQPPIDLTIIGAPDCLFAVNPTVAAPLAIDLNGEADYSFSIGGLPANAVVNLQAALIDFGAPRALQITLSDNRLAWVIGEDNFQ